MVKFISLSQACGNDAFKELIINAAHIQHVVIGNKGKDVHIRMSDGTFFFVRESLAEIKRLIADVPIPAQPILMTADEYARYNEAKRMRDAALSNMVGLSNLNSVQLVSLTL